MNEVGRRGSLCECAMIELFLCLRKIVKFDFLRRSYEFLIICMKWVDFESMKVPDALHMNTLMSF